MFRGLSAFPLTPLAQDEIDEPSYTKLIQRLATSGVDSITALGSTGSYAYLSREERARVAELAVAHAGSVPVFIGVGALRTSEVLHHVRSAEAAGAQGILLAPMTYQPLRHDDVFELFSTVNEATDLPIIVYDNPGTTHFTFDLDLYARIAALSGVRSIKIPALPEDAALATHRVAEIRSVIPEDVTIGISGDASAATGLAAGCDAWYSVIAGTLPEVAVRVMREGVTASKQWEPLWQLFSDMGGSIRVVAAIAEELGLAGAQCLPLPIQGLTPAERERVRRTMETCLLS